MTRPDLPALIYATNCRIIGATPVDYATLPAHRHARWARVAEHWIAFTRNRPWTYGQCLYEAVRIDTYGRRWHQLNPVERTIWSTEGCNLASRIKREQELAA
jgi:hypothetical protein